MLGWSLPVAPIAQWGLDRGLTGIYRVGLGRLLSWGMSVLGSLGFLGFRGLTVFGGFRVQIITQVHTFYTKTLSYTKLHLFTTNYMYFKLRLNKLKLGSFGRTSAAVQLGDRCNYKSIRMIVVVAGLSVPRIGVLTGHQLVQHAHSDRRRVDREMHQ